MKLSYWFFLLFFLAACESSVNQKEVVSVAKKLYDIPVSCDFSKVRNNRAEENECSPKLDDPFFSEFEGVLINIPKKVVWPKNERIEDSFVGRNGQREGSLRLMLAGLLKIPYGTLGIEDDFKYQILVVAVNRLTAQTYKGRMSRLGDKPARRNVSSYNPAEKGLHSQENFNIDLVHNLELPIIEAQYDVYAAFGNYKSNTAEVIVTIE